MTSLLRMTSLTPETDSKTAPSSPSRHLGLIWHFAHTELLTSDLCPTAFCLPPGQPHPVFCRLRLLSGALALGTATELAWAVSLCGATGEEVRVRASQPQSCKCERLAGSDGAGGNIYFLTRSLFTPWASNKEPLQANSQFWHLPFSAGADLCYTIVECCLSFTFPTSLSFLSVSYFSSCLSLQGSWSPSARWLLPCSEVARARLAPVSVACVPSISVAYPQVTLTL